MMLFALGMMMLATAAAAGADEVTATSYILPNLNPPSDLPPELFQVEGKVTMTQPQSGGNTTMIVHLAGLVPDTPHGFHIHAYGDTFSDGCQSTGSHYNPENVHHGGPTDAIRHFGDLGNLQSDEGGAINAEIIDYIVSLVGPNSVAGRAFVIHQKRDDLGRGTGAAKNESLKTGNAGARLGCGIIFLTQPPTP